VVQLLSVDLIPLFKGGNIVATITNDGLSKILEVIKNEFTHVGLGNATGNLSNASTQLSNEFYRLQVTEDFVDGQTAVIEIYIDENQGNGVIKQVGLFAQGTSAPNSGTLTVAENVDLSKSNTESMTISFEITLERR
jgi:hypothetical protein